MLAGDLLFIVTGNSIGIKNVINASWKGRSNGHMFAFLNRRKSVLCPIGLKVKVTDNPTQDVMQVMDLMSSITCAKGPHRPTYI